MVNISNVLSVIFVIILKLKDWEERVPEGLRKMFEEIGDVSPRRQPAVSSNHEQPRPKGEVFMESTANCGLQDFFNNLCDADFQTFSATSDINMERESVTLRFMLCPRDEVNWEDTRPFGLMHAACGEAMSMAKGYRTKVYNNHYVKAGQELDGKRALSVNATEPLWEAKRSRRRLLIAHDGEVVVE